MIREIILSQRNSSRNSENAIASTRFVRQQICHSSRKFRSDPSRTRANHGDVASSFQERRSRGEYISGPRVLSRRISPPLPHMQHRYWQQPLIIPGTPTAIHNCHSHYNLHLGHCETVACVSTALLRRLSLIQLYSVDVPSYHYTARARSLARARSRSRKERGTGNSECRKEHGKSTPGTSLTSDSAINWRTARSDIRDVSSDSSRGRESRRKHRTSADWISRGRYPAGQRGTLVRPTLRTRSLVNSKTRSSFPRVSSILLDLLSSFRAKRHPARSDKRGREVPLIWQRSERRLTFSGRTDGGRFKR